ncbi:MAG: aspartate aminotransferase family protein, partial [Acidimicrobiaceae bacterium]|nr:aspartate aminotransferase family protein [Acidimicrobiaceae bacterium]
AHEVADGIRECDHLELVMEPDLSVVLFRRPGWSEEQMTAWSDKASRDGVALIVPTRWHDELMFRMCFVNPRTRSERVLRVLDTMA